MSPDGWAERAERVAERVERARFSPVRLVAGYDQGQVDDLLDQLVTAAKHGRGLRSLVESARFDRTRLREGYAMGEVDTFLADLAAYAP